MWNIYDYHVRDAIRAFIKNLSQQSVFLDKLGDKFVGNM